MNLNPEYYNNDLKPAWCPGCGNFAILGAIKKSLAQLNKAPHEVLLVSGIGQSSKLPHYLKSNVFNGLHGRLLPAAQGAKVANKNLTVIGVGGDGDNYGEGGNHFIHAIRRNIDITLLVHNNQIYGLTKGQASPTSDFGMKTKVQAYGNLLSSFNPLSVAVSLDCGFVSRGFAGDTEHLVSLIKEAVNYKGFSLVDILQPCVTFNKLNTYKWYRERVYDVNKGSYDFTNRQEAFSKSLEWGKRIPIGIIYKNDKTPYHELVDILKKEPLVNQPHNLKQVKTLMDGFK